MIHTLYTSPFFLTGLWTVSFLYWFFWDMKEYPYRYNFLGTIKCLCDAGMLAFGTIGALVFFSAIIELGLALI